MEFSRGAQAGGTDEPRIDPDDEQMVDSDDEQMESVGETEPGSPNLPELSDCALENADDCEPEMAPSATAHSKNDHEEGTAGHQPTEEERVYPGGYPRAPMTPTGKQQEESAEGMCPGGWPIVQEEVPVDDQQGQQHTGKGDLDVVQASPGGNDLIEQAEQQQSFGAGGWPIP